MSTNDTNKIIYRELSYQINGFLFEVHNILGRFAREKQYGDLLETKLKENGLSYEREKMSSIIGIGNNRTNLIDFVVENKILLELKVKPIITKEDYGQIQRYLQANTYKLGLLINFRNKYLKPIRIIRKDS